MFWGAVQPFDRLEHAKQSIFLSPRPPFYDIQGPKKPLRQIKETAKAKLPAFEPPRRLRHQQQVLQDDRKFKADLVYARLQARWRAYEANQREKATNKELEDPKCSRGSAALRSQAS